MVEPIGRRALNRATLARQLLLERTAVAPLDAVRHLVGLQSQVPHNPYTALWSRLEGFRPESLSRLLEERELVRVAVMRATIHLVTAGDCLQLRPLVQPILTAELQRHRDHSPELVGVDLEPVLAFARRLLATPRSGPQLRDALAERFPELDPAALAYACRCRLALVQVPPRGLWGRTGQVTTATAESWLGRPLEAQPSIDEVVLRYLAAFGPASVADVSTWCRLTRLRDVVERLRPRLLVFRDERGRELFDLPHAPRPGPDASAPVRFLPEYDNLLLSHADRSRFVSAEDRRAIAPAWTLGWGAVLHDGAVRAVWRSERDGVVVRHLPLTQRAAGAVAAEGRRLARFLGVEPVVRLEPVSR
jgi:hypothetical protein